MTIASATLLGGRYRLDHQIAVGGMGEVWRAADVVLGRDVAAKVLRGELTARAGFLERFRREARNLAMLSHSAIAAVFDYGDHDGSPFLIMELVVGEDAARRIARQGVMPPSEVIDLMAQVAAGLAVAHAAGLVHRDIKPANLMITDGGRIKITDFGISRHADSLTLTSTQELLGTPHYMPPEQFRGEPASAAGDVYSLAVVAYELLAGRPPFVADSNIAIAFAQVHELPPPLPATVPRPLAVLIGRALAKDPQRRPPDGEALVREIEQLSELDDATRSAPPGALVDVSPTLTDGLFAPTVALPPAEILQPTVAFTESELRAPLEIGPQDDAAVGTLIGPMRRHRTKRRIAAGLTASMVLALVAAIVFARRSDDPLGEPATTSVPAPATTSGSTISASSDAGSTTTVAPPSSTALVVIDLAAFVGRDRREVIDELRALGFIVEERRIDSPDAKKNTVVAIEPNGALAPGTTVEVQVAKSGKGGAG